MQRAGENIDGLKKNLMSSESVALQKLNSALKATYQEFLSISYIKNNILFFQFSHPGIASEFKMNIPRIKDDLRVVYKREQLGKVIRFTDIKGYFRQPNIVVDYFSVDAKRRKEMCKFEEQSNGDFEIKSKDRTIKSLFEDIQKIIKEKRGKKL